MKKLKETLEIRANSEIEAKEVMEKFCSEAAEKGYILGSCGYTKKEKKAKGEIIDDGYLIKVSMIYGGFWDGLE